MTTDMNTKQDKATPRPWRWVGTQGKPSKNCYLQGGEDTYRTILFIDGGDISDANAALIVQAVNEYDRLKAIEEAARFLLDCMARGTPVDVMRKALAALDKTRKISQ